MSPPLQSLRAVALLSALLLPAAARATCTCIGPPDQFIQSPGQLNFVIRDGDDVRLIPNIRITGDADDFALIVPTPALPTLTPVNAAIWAEAAQLTRPQVRRRFGLDGLGCSEALVQSDSGPGVLSAETDGLIVHSQQTVGAFDATIVSSTDPMALTTWLTDRGYLADSTVTGAFDPLLAAGWFFTAMKLRPGTPVPSGGWNTTVDPVEFRYAADTFDIPLEVIAINAAFQISVTVYAVDSRRMALPGFRTRYANRISGSESAAILERYPALGPFLEPGRTLTRLDRSFPATGLSGTVRLVPAAIDEEFREIARGPEPSGSIPGDLILLAAPFLWFKLRRGRSSL